jgi:hypothetical protein
VVQRLKDYVQRPLVVLAEVALSSFEALRPEEPPQDDEGVEDQIVALSVVYILLELGQKAAEVRLQLSMQSLSQSSQSIHHCYSNLQILAFQLFEKRINDSGDEISEFVSGTSLSLEGGLVAQFEVY